MKKIKITEPILFALLLVLLVSCTGKASDKQQVENSVTYETYHNDRYGYTVEYPNFLEPQGESDSQDGQQFISADRHIQLLVYRGYKINFLSKEGAECNLQEAYTNDLAGKDNVLNSKLKENSYIITYKDDNLHTLYTHKANNGYINILFYYPEQEKEKLEEVMEYVINSLKIDN